MPHAPPTASTKPRTVPSRAISTDSHRIARADLAAGHADRPQQPELTGPLVHRQGQRVGDADEGDDHGQGQQAVDQVEHLSISPVMASLNSAWSCSSAFGHSVERRLEGRPRRRPRRRRRRSPTNTWRSNWSVTLASKVSRPTMPGRRRRRATSPSKSGPTVSATSPVAAKRTVTRVAEREARRRAALSAVDGHAVAVHVGDRAVGDLEVVEPVDDGGVDRHAPRWSTPSTLDRRRAHRRQQRRPRAAAAGRPRSAGLKPPGPTSRSRRRSRPGSDSSTAAAIDALVELARMVMKPDEGHADHQGRRGGRRAPGVALGVLPGEAAGGAGQPRSATPSTRMTGRAMHRAEHEHPEDHAERAEAEQRAGRPGPSPTTPAAKATTPTPVSGRPTTVRRSDAPVRSMATSAQGGDRARPGWPARAGTTADSTRDGDADHEGGR